MRFFSFMSAFLERAMGEDRFRFLKYLAVGGWNTVFGVSLYSLLCWCFQDKVHYLLLLIPSNVVAVLNAYLCYKFFVFKTKGDYFAEFFRCGLVYGGAMVCSAGILFLMVDCGGFTPIIGNVVSVGIVTIVSYLAHTCFSFRKTGGVDKMAIAFYLILAGTACLFFLSAHRIPLFWLDEIHITEMGRTVLTWGKGEVSFMCLPDGTAFLPFYYLGPLIQEVAYRIFGYVGPRWSALAGLLAATIFCRWWLLRRTGATSTAFWFPLLVLTHPFFNQSARLVRVDSWTFALFFVALWLINATGRNDRAARWKDSMLLLGAGFLCVVAVYVWPTAFLFAGYCAVEFLRVRQSRSFLAAAVFFAGGFVIGGILFLLPIPDFGAVVLKTLRGYFNVGVDAQKPSFDLLSAVFGFSFFIFKETFRSPFVMFLCGWGLFLNRKDWRVLLITILSAGIVVVSNLHTFRLIYLFPLLLMFAAEAFEILRKRNRCFGVFVAFALGYGICVSVLFYAFSASVYSARDYSTLRGRLAATLGTGPEVRVYSRAFESYYPARDLAWTCFRYANDDLLAEDTSNLKLLDRVDYVVDSGKKKCRYYSVEEGGAFYHLLRDCCIQRAERDEQGLLAGIGRRFAFQDSDTEREKTASILAKSGFRKYAVLEFSSLPSGVGSRLLDWVSVPAGYNDLVIWKREKPLVLELPKK